MRGTLDRAQALHLEGRFSEAEDQYRDVLQWQPDAVDATVTQELRWRIAQAGRRNAVALSLGRGNPADGGRLSADSQSCDSPISWMSVQATMRQAELASWTPLLPARSEHPRPAGEPLGSAFHRQAR